jgi:hypothetical protein
VKLLPQEGGGCLVNLLSKLLEEIFKGRELFFGWKSRKLEKKE